MKKPSQRDTAAEQSARFREAAKKVGGADAKAFERAFKKIVPIRKPTKKSA